MQDVTFCGPMEEECVANQTLKHKDCLIPCTGLYADIVDVSLKQRVEAIENYVVKGETIDLLFFFYTFTRFPHNF